MFCRISFIFLIVVFSNLFSQAQDGQISMFTTSPMMLNPAAVGSFQTDSWRVWLNHRDQWSSFLSRGIVTSNLSFDMPIASKKMAVGIYASNNMATKGALNDLYCMAAFGYTVKFGHSYPSVLSFGLHAGIKQRNYNPGKISFESQFEEGLGFNSGISNGELTANTSKLLPDFNAGALWFVNDKWKKLRPWFGIGAYHLLSPNQSFTTIKDKLPQKYILYSGAEIIANQLISAKPQLVFTKQGNLNQSSIGASVAINNYKNKNSSTFEIGTYYRNKESIVAMLGFEFSHYSCFIDYEITSSKLHAINNGNGAFEITLRYMMKSAREKAKF